MRPLHAVITGACGFIGAATTRELLASGARVTALLRPESNRARLAPGSGLGILQYTSLADPETAASLKATQPDVFIHCAWRGVSGADRNEAFQVGDNVRMSLDAVELAAAAGCQRWIGLGSQAEYGNQNRRLNEEAPLRPTTLYGKAKLAAGIACLALCEAQGLSGAWLRVFSTYGPGDSPRWLLPFVLGEFRAGRSPELTLCTQLWDYLHVDDASRAISAIAVAHGISGNYNLGSGTARPLRHWIDLLRQVTGTQLEPRYGRIPFRPDQVMHLEADISRLSAATGWKPIVSATSGIASLVASF